MTWHYEKIYAEGETVTYDYTRGRLAYKILRLIDSTSTKPTVAVPKRKIGIYTTYQMADIIRKNHDKKF